MVVQDHNPCPCRETIVGMMIPHVNPTNLAIPWKNIGNETSYGLFVVYDEKKPYHPHFHTSIKKKNSEKKFVTSGVKFGPRALSSSWRQCQ
jgi:hypothetical protein